MNSILKILTTLFILTSCANPKIKQVNLSFIDTINTHLHSISMKDINLMKSTLANSGEFYLTLPNGSITTTIKEFTEGQSQWFETKGWHFSTEIIKSEHGNEYGYVLVIADYREDDRAGKPYHHKMFVSYDLKKVKNRWQIVKDHASTITKSE